MRALSLIENPKTFNWFPGQKIVSSLWLTIHLVLVTWPQVISNPTKVLYWPSLFIFHSLERRLPLRSRLEAARFSINMTVIFFQICRYQAITWISADLLLIGPCETNFSEMYSLNVRLIVGTSMCLHFTTNPISRGHYVTGHHGGTV